MAISLETPTARRGETDAVSTSASDEHATWIAFLVMMSFVALGILATGYAVMTMS